MRINGDTSPTARYRQIMFRLLLVVVAVLPLTACGGIPTSSFPGPAPVGTLRIVSSLPSKGIYRKETELTRRAIDLALTTLSSNREVSIEHVAIDGGSDETGEWNVNIEEANARAAAADKSVVAYIGPHNSGAVGVALPITSRAGLLTSSPSATWPGLTMPGWDNGEPARYYPTGVLNFARLSPPDSLQAAAAADWAKAEKRKNVLVIHDGSSYSEGMARALAGDFPVEEDAIVEVSTDADNLQLPALEGYDAVYYAPSSVQSARRVVAALGESSLPIYSSDVALDPQFLEAVGALEEWRIVGNSGVKNDVGLNELFPDTPPEVTARRPALNAYIVARLVVEAVQNGATDQEAVLAHVRGKRLGDGKPLFDEAGDPTIWSMTGFRAVNGVFQPVREFSR